MSEYFKIDYNQDGWPIVTMDNEDIGRKKILQLLNSKTQKIEQLKKENELYLELLDQFAVYLRTHNHKAVDQAVLFSILTKDKE